MKENFLKLQEQVRVLTDKSLCASGDVIDLLLGLLGFKHNLWKKKKNLPLRISSLDIETSKIQECQD